MAGHYELLDRTKALVEQEQELRGRSKSTEIDDDDKQRLDRLKDELDRCWEVLRNRSARRQRNRDGDDATASSSDPVQGRLGI